MRARIAPSSSAAPQWTAALAASALRLIRDPRIFHPWPPASTSETSWHPTMGVQLLGGGEQPVTAHEMSSTPALPCAVRESMLPHARLPRISSTTKSRSGQVVPQCSQHSVTFCERVRLMRENFLLTIVERRKRKVVELSRGGN
ncbi:hypothetical protein V5799_020156 [Amblyomma americanum]|uniref:Uncharacterized protein n=1 Tax=Amblyomma americanum TaxID=6943 RepID=A0AAQ4EVK4_AMBAM